jgi:putative PIN family toxin of toxin-antitoxin system
MKRIACDTNVLISAFVFPGSKPDLVVRLARSGEVNHFTSPFILSEVGKVLSHKFGLSKEKTAEALDLLTGFSTIVKPMSKVTVIKAKDDDNRILECALDAGVEFVVSGDKRHLLPLKQHCGIRIVSPAQFLALHLRKKA